MRWNLQGELFGGQYFLQRVLHSPPEEEHVEAKQNGNGVYPKEKVILVDCLVQEMVHFLVKHVLNVTVAVHKLAIEAVYEQFHIHVPLQNLVSLFAELHFLEAVRVLPVRRPPHQGRTTIKLSVCVSRKTVAKQHRLGGVNDSVSEVQQSLSVSCRLLIHVALEIICPWAVSLIHDLVVLLVAVIGSIGNAMCMPESNRFVGGFVLMDQVIQSLRELLLVFSHQTIVQYQLSCKHYNSLRDLLSSPRFTDYRGQRDHF
mmetsp:Transcript_32714/g.51011  ORF Transcript_32714/g.51011 Transcript_32714/m.51011 type:complete len:258 (+) Transcript_32714:247-1020(+)